MKKVWAFMILAAMVVLMAACGGENTSTGSSGDQGQQGGNQEVKKIKAGVGLNENHPQYQALLKFKEIVEQKTNGQIKVETYYSGQLGDDRQMIENVQLGSQEVTIPSTAPLANFVPDFNILNMPFMIQDPETADAVLDGEAGQALLKKLESANMVGLNYWEEGFYNISNNVRPIQSAADLKGIKIRTMENQILLDVFKTLGANPTPMAFGEVYTALQQGVVDAQTNPPSQIYEAKFHEVQDYVSATNDFYGVWVFLVNKEFYDGLTPEQQTIVKEAADEARDYQRQLARQMEQEYVDKLIAEGVQYNDVTPEARAEMKQIIQPVLDKYLKDLDPEIVNKFNEAIEQARGN